MVGAVDSTRLVGAADSTAESTTNGTMDGTAVVAADAISGRALVLAPRYGTVDGTLGGTADGTVVGTAVGIGDEEETHVQHYE